MSRYQKILDLIDLTTPQTIVEIGTWNGTNAVRMIQQASKHNSNIQYIGYDLFEEATEETDRLEFNVKPHNKVDDIKAFIQSHCPEAEIALVRGNTNDTLTDITADFVFIDGGHSVETIESDYECVRQSSVIVFDDYYTPDENGLMPDLYKVGCNKLVETLPHMVIESQDRVSGGGFVNLAVVFGGSSDEG